MWIGDTGEKSRVLLRFVKLLIHRNWWDRWKREAPRLRNTHILILPPNTLSSRVSDSWNKQSWPSHSPMIFHWPSVTYRENWPSVTYRENPHSTAQHTYTYKQYIQTYKQSFVCTYIQTIVCSPPRTGCVLTHLLPLPSTRTRLQAHWISPSLVLSAHAENGCIPETALSWPLPMFPGSDCLSLLPRPPALTSVISWMTLFCNNRLKLWPANCSGSSWRAGALPNHLDIRRAHTVPDT